MQFLYPMPNPILLVYISYPALDPTQANNLKISGFKHEDREKPRTFDFLAHTKSALITPKIAWRLEVAATPTKSACADFE
ncbi:hypothetical protein [Pseudanabaena sp. PCC 6802]|uniref:hypothetical protein n=1 Tax=Pseudanabaena sp. PCC 6802 TaxID=118173 RepID=UPI000370989C|nr:hypothetical protein [Pseudanabaena sp. PCC 6802]